MRDVDDMPDDEHGGGAFVDSAAGTRTDFDSVLSINCIVTFTHKVDISTRCRINLRGGLISSDE